MNRKVNILGTQYSIEERSESEDKLLQDCDGYCDWTMKLIVIVGDFNGTLGDAGCYIRKVLRHEIVHAFALESGLHECSGSTEAWARNEEMVDWFARQGPKIYAAWEEAGALESEKPACHIDVEAIARQVEKDFSGQDTCGLLEGGI